MPKLFYLLCISLLTSQNLQAQILNADKFETSVDSTNFVKGVFDIGMNMNKQKTLIIAFDSKLDFSYWFKHNILIIVGKFKLFRTGSKNLLNGGYSHLRLRLLQNFWVHPEIFLQYQLDGVRGMEQRILVGANLRFRIKEFAAGRLDIGLGYMYEYERWGYSGVASGVIIIDDSPIKNHYTKLNIYFSAAQKIKEVVEIQGMLYFQARPDSYITRPRISTDLQIGFKITKNIRFSIKYSLIYDALPVVPIDHVYYSMVNKISFVW